MKLVIFSEAGFVYGFGHFYRMSGVCEAAIKAGMPVEMHLMADETARANLDREYVRFTNWMEPAEYTRILSDDVTLVMDSYHVSVEQLETYRSLCRDMIVIDDNIRLEYRNMKILNPNYFAEWLTYPPEGNNTVYAGRDCTLLRDEFVITENRSVAREVSEILITMGGTDLKGLTAAAVRLIRRISEDVKLHIVCTPAYPDLDTIRAMLKENDILHFNIGAEEMSKLMRTCDFAVATAGGTTNELVKMQCPSLLIPVADNQLINIKFLSEYGFIEVMQPGDGEANLEILRSMFSYEKRKSIGDKLATFRSDMSGKDIILNIAFNGGKNE